MATESLKDSEAYGTYCQFLLDYFALRVEKEGKKRDELTWKKIKVRKRKGRKKLEQVKRKKWKKREEE